MWFFLYFFSFHLSNLCSYLYNEHLLFKKSVKIIKLFPLSKSYDKRCVLAKLPQLCLSLCDPKDCSLPGSSVRGILQARILEWVAMSSSFILDSKKLWKEHWTCCWQNEIKGHFFSVLIVRLWTSVSGPCLKTEDNDASCSTSQWYHVKCSGLGI